MEKTSPPMSAFPWLISLVAVEPGVLVGAADVGVTPPLFGVGVGACVLPAAVVGVGGGVGVAALPAVLPVLLPGVDETAVPALVGAAVGVMG